MDNKQFGFVMDAMSIIRPEKDGTIALIEAAQNQGIQSWVMHLNDLMIENGEPYARMSNIQLHLGSDPWYEFTEERYAPLTELSVIMMRKDPPVDLAYIYATQILELAEEAGVKVFNRPQALRDYNEKLMIAKFPECIADTLVTADRQKIQMFFDTHQDVIVKPLDGMGGSSVYRLQDLAEKSQAIIDEMTRSGQKYIMLQQFLPAVFEGDKRIFLVNGEPIEKAVLRVPAKGNVRANLAAGGTAKVVPLTKRDDWLCEQISPTLKKAGLFFVGLDVIGDYITEINVTCPTCLRELYAGSGIDLAQIIINQIIN